jgi:hypothetical protein
MDRNGKKPKASTASPNAERSDMKASARDTLGKAGAPSRAASDERAGKARNTGGKAQPRGQRP